MWLKRSLKIILITFVALAILAGAFIGSVYIGIFGPLPGREEIAHINHEEASLVYSRDGTIIGKFFAENRTNIKWEDVPRHLINALVATEDKRFFEHEGIDGRSYLRVLVKSILLRDRRAGGGSTITQQLVKNLYGRPDHGALSLPVSKTREAIIASRMEQVLSKDDILLLYLNSVPFGEEVFGVEAAAKRYFDKSASALNLQESAVLVGILKANTLYNPRLYPESALNRRNTVIGLMAKEGFVTGREADSLSQLPLGLKYTNYQLASPAGYFVYQVKQQAVEILRQLSRSDGNSYDLLKDGLRIHTTLDIRLQQLANKSAREQLIRMQPLLDDQLHRSGARGRWESGQEGNEARDPYWTEKGKREILTLEGMQTVQINRLDSLWHYHKMLNAAVLAADPRTGAVLAWTGGNHFRYLPYDLVLARRQIASTVKPFIYAAALEEGFTSCDYFENTVKEYREFNGWRPENYDGSSTERMKVAMWYALSQSLNLPTVDLYFSTGHEQVADLCRRFGLEAPYEETPALALGALDASLYDLVKAYAAFAGQGLMPKELVMISHITDAEGNIIYADAQQEKIRVMSRKTAAEITGMLEVAIDAGTGSGMRNNYGVTSDLAGKTGTAQDYRDAWFITYTPGLVVGTWVGARSPGMHFTTGMGSGSSLALPIAGSIISAVEGDPQMKSTWLVRFEPADHMDGIFDCEAFREKGLKGMIRRMIRNDPEDSLRLQQPPVEDSSAEKKSKFKRFFERVFRKDKKKEKD